MNLRFLETFVWVARLQSFSGAATKLNATQAAISSRIKALEDSLGVRLFDRDIRSEVRLTPEGHKALEGAELLVRQSKEFIANVSDKNAIRGTLTIGTIDAVVHAWLPQLINVLQDRFPQVRCNIVIGTSQDLLRQLQAGALDLGILSTQVSQPMIKSVHLGSFKWAWVASSALEFPEGDITLANLVEYPIITFPEGSPSHAEVTHILRSSGFRFKVHTSNSITTITQLVIGGVGVSLMPLVGIESILTSGALRILPVETTFPALSYSACYTERPADALPKIAAEMARDVAKSFADEYYVTAF